MSSCYSVLRIGPVDNDNAALLCSAISSHFHGSSSSIVTDGVWCEELTISNRYFTASVLLTGLHDDPPIPNYNSLLQEDGRILIFDASHDAPITQSFDSLTPIHTSLEPTTGELLRLCIGMAHGPSPLSDGTKTSEEEYSRRVLWCLDRGYEYIEVDVTEDGMKQGHEEREKEGFARVIEAMSCCMWNSHVMKNGENPTPLVETQVVTEPTEKGRRNVDSSDSTIERESAAMASLMNGIEEETGSMEPSQTKQQEMAFHELDQIMSEAKRIREASKNDSLSDDERRQRAGDTAVRLMELLDKLGLDEDEEDDDSDVDAST